MIWKTIQVIFGIFFGLIILKFCWIVFVIIVTAFALGG